MATMWADYFKEREGRHTIETDRGFISSSVFGKTYIVQDFYVVPEFRGSPTAVRLANDAVKDAIAAGCTDFCAEVYRADPLFDYVVGLYKHWGMTRVSDDENRVIMNKKLENSHADEQVAVH